MTTLPSAFRLLMGRSTSEASAFEGGFDLISAAPSRAVDSVAKRWMDLVGAIGGLFLLAPLLALVALAVRLEGGGPIFFRQKRAGYQGGTFTCLKFRTMVVDAERRLDALEARNESASGVLFKIKDDPRVTPLGRFLRKTSLDELPQLWNVLVGEMSLIGPRPLQLRDSDRLRAIDPTGSARRLSALPGLSGPWQVAGRSEIDGLQMLDLDLDYIDQWSLGLDLSLIARTLAVVCSGRGAS